MNKNINLLIFEFKNKHLNYYSENNQLENGESILKRELVQEYSIDYLKIQDELKLKSKESVLASRLVQGIELLKIFLKLLSTTTTSSSNEEKLQCIEPLAKLLLFEPYIVNEKTLSSSDKEKTIEILKELAVTFSSCHCNQENHKFINVALVGLNLMYDNKDARDELIQVLDGLLDLKEYKQDLDFTFMRGKLYLMNGQFKFASNDFNFIVNNKNSGNNKNENNIINESVYFYLGESLRYFSLEVCDIKILEDSIQAYKQFIQISPNDSLRIDYSYFCISHLYFIIQNIQQSKIFYEKGLLASSKQLSIFNKSSNNNNNNQNFNLDKLLN